MDKKRYDVLEGHTKVQDGVAGRVKRSRDNQLAAAATTGTSKRNSFGGEYPLLKCA